MARIHCKYIGCILLENGICSATTIELDPDEGCLTFSQIDDPFEDDDWDDEEELDGYDEWDDDEGYDDVLYDDDDFE